MTVGYIPAALAVALLVWAIVVFNRLVRLRNQVRTAWADIDVQLMRRHDLVPQLVAAVQAYAGHERATLDAVTALRTQAIAARDTPALSSVEQALGEAMARLIALHEAYPALAASANFAQLQTDLVALETQLQYARRFYNGAVRDFNDGVQRVPDVLVARATGIGPAAFFQAEATARGPVAVELAH